MALWRILIFIELIQASVILPSRVARRVSMLLVGSNQLCARLISINIGWTIKVRSRVQDYFYFFDEDLTTLVPHADWQGSCALISSLNGKFLGWCAIFGYHLHCFISLTIELESYMLLIFETSRRLKFDANLELRRPEPFTDLFGWHLNLKLQGVFVTDEILWVQFSLGELVQV